MSDVEEKFNKNISDNNYIIYLHNYYKWKKMIKEFYEYSIICINNIKFLVDKYKNMIKFKEIHENINFSISNNFEIIYKDLLQLIIKGLLEKYKLIDLFFLFIHLLTH